jgi:MerR family transcriptional regulator, thiopeptide resistance regulator
MSETLTIDEVVRQTGLTSRALRFYEARGLIAPLRTASGRRSFGSAELTRVHQIVALKKAGLSLMAIGRLFERKPIDLATMLRAQLELLETQASDIAQARDILTQTLSRIDRGEPITAETLCSLIQNGDRIMTEEAQAWKKVTDRYFSEEDKAHWSANMQDVQKDWEQSDYSAQWKDLGGRIKAALPLDPTSPAAFAFLDEWQDLLRPFMKVATVEMKTGAFQFYEKMGEWQGDLDVGFDQQVWDFIKQVGAAREPKLASQSL